MTLPRRLNEINRRHVAIVMFVLAGLALLAPRWQSAEGTVQSAQLASVGEKGGLIARGGLQTNQVTSSGRLQLWFSFENGSGSPVSGLRLVDLQAPGFVEVGSCWVNHAPACGSDGKTRGTDAKAESSPKSALKAGEATIVSAELAPAAYSGSYRIVAVYDWQGAAGGELRGGLALGPVEVVTSWREGPLNAIKRLRALIAQFGLPVALLIVGYVLQNQQKARDERQAILNTLLPESQRVTQKLYMPFIARLETLINTAGHAANEQERLQLFYTLVLFLRQQKLLVDEVGGHHFQNREGERIVALAWSVFAVHLKNRFPLQPRSALLKLIEPREEMSTFVERMEQERVLTELRGQRGPLFQSKAFVDAWIDDSASPLTGVLPALRILNAVFFFEINRPFERWYGTKWEFPGKELNSALKDLDTDQLLHPTNASPNDLERIKTAVEALKKKLERYIEAGEKWATPYSSSQTL